MKEEEEETLRDLFCFKNATMARSEQCSALLATRQQRRGVGKKLCNLFLLNLTNFQSKTTSKGKSITRLERARERGLGGNNQLINLA